MPIKYIPKEPFENIKRVTEDEYYHKLGFTKLSNGDWVGPYQKIGINLRHVLT